MDIVAYCHVSLVTSCKKKKSDNLQILEMLEFADVNTTLQRIKPFPTVDFIQIGILVISPTSPESLSNNPVCILLSM